MNRVLIPILLVLRFGSLVSWAGPLEDGVAAHQRGDYPVALGLFQSLAAQGNVAAQYNLGQMHRLGQGIPKDLVDAARWYYLAAAQGDGQSQYNLGVMHYNGQGVVQNFVTSYMWLTLAAMAGVENAARNRAVLAKQMTPEQIKEALERSRTCEKRNFQSCG